MVKEKGGKPDRKPNPLPYGLKNPCRNLKSENSQDYAHAETSMKLYIHEFGFWFTYRDGNLSRAMGARNQVGIGLSYRPASLSSSATQFQTRFLESNPRPIAGLKFSTPNTREWYPMPRATYST
jgi:hypothetical protein